MYLDGGSFSAADLASLATLRLPLLCQLLLGEQEEPSCTDRTNHIIKPKEQREGKIRLTIILYKGVHLSPLRLHSGALGSIDHSGTLWQPFGTLSSHRCS